MANVALEVSSHYGNLTLPTDLAPVDGDIMSELAKAVYVGDVALVQKLLRQGARVNAPSRVYDSERGVWRWELPAGTAARLGNSQVLKALLAAGALIDLSDPGIGKSPLHWACSRGHLDAARLLIEQGASVNKADFFSEVPLGEAVSRRDVAMVRLLLDGGAALNETLNHDRDSALLFAVLIKDSAISRLLLQAGACPGHVNREGDDALLALLRDGDHTDATWWDFVRIIVSQGPRLRPKHHAELKSHPASAAVDLISKNYNRPRSLQVLSRNQIRDLMLDLNGHTSVLPSIEKLSLAPWLKAYLRYDYI